MRLVTTQDLYHRKDCDSDLMKMIGHEAKRQHKSAKKLEEEGYNPCPYCLPERAES